MQRSSADREAQFIRLERDLLTLGPNGKKHTPNQICQHLGDAEAGLAGGLVGQECREIAISLVFSSPLQGHKDRREGHPYLAQPGRRCSLRGVWAASGDRPPRIIPSAPVRSATKCERLWQPRRSPSLGRMLTPGVECQASAQHLGSMTPEEFAAGLASLPAGAMPLPEGKPLPS